MVSTVDSNMYNISSENGSGTIACGASSADAGLTAVAGVEPRWKKALKKSRIEHERNGLCGAMVRSCAKLTVTRDIGYAMPQINPSQKGNSYERMRQIKVMLRSLNTIAVIDRFR